MGRKKILVYLALITALVVALTMLPLQFVSAGPQNGCAIVINDVDFQTSTDRSTWWDMPGDDFVYKLCVDGDPETNYYIRFDGDLTTATLKDQHFGLYFWASQSTVSTATLQAYYDARTSLPTNYRDYLKAAADEDEPFALINGATEFLADAAKWYVGHFEDHMTIPGDYPTGTYTVISEELVDECECTAIVTYKLIISRCFPSTEAAEPEPEPIWERGDQKMVCYQVWVNDDGCFEFVFWWEYKENNWVKIYDKDGKEVFSINMQYGKPRFEACLDDGTYTVKTFHNNMSTPLQEFTISKP